jgi:ribose-phosphate pyrophosphokinase
MLIISTNSNKALAQKIARQAKLKLGRVEIKHLSDGETYLRIKDPVKGKRVFVIGSTFQPESNLTELLLLLNACKVNGAKNIILILPYFGYARQDKIFKPGECLSSQLMVNLFKTAGANKVIAIDLHSPRVVKHFDSGLINLLIFNDLADHCKKFIDIHKAVVVAPDHGARKRALQVAKKLGLKSVIVIKKSRPRQNVVKIQPIKRNLVGKHVVIVDDLVDTAGTLIAAAQEIKKHGAQKICVIVTHGVLSGPAIARLRKPTIDKILVSDTIPLDQRRKTAKISVISVVANVCKAIEKIK